MLKRTAKPFYTKALARKEAVANTVGALGDFDEAAKIRSQIAAAIHIRRDRSARGIKRRGRGYLSNL